MCVIEKLASRTESPQTVSECSGSHDDSGHVSGGSQGTTPEHKRTDSNYSASSIPSTLSTVTDVAILARFALILLIVITSGSRGGVHPARPPPQRPRTYDFLMPKTLFFSIFPRSLRSRII